MCMLRRFSRPDAEAELRAQLGEEKKRQSEIASVNEQLKWQIHLLKTESEDVSFLGPL